jgi:transposase
MFTRTNPQLSLFDISRVIPNALPKDDWCFIYRDRICPLIDEEQFRHLYKGESGRPNKPIKTMVSLLIFMGMEKETWRGVVYQFPRRIDWLAATRTLPGEAMVDHTTLFKFYQRMETSEVGRKLFEQLTVQFIEMCGTTLRKQRTDSFFINGWLQILSRYGLFKETIRVFLGELEKQKPELYGVISKELSREYLGKEFDLTEKDHEAAQRQIRQMAQDLYRIHKAFVNHDEVKEYGSFKTLTTVFQQQCKVEEAKTEGSCEIVIREKPEGEEIVSSPHNTDARYVKKGKQKVCGQKGFVTETCDGTNKTQFITDVEVTPATTADAKELPEIQGRLKESKMKLEDQYGDAGFVNGQTIVSSSKNAIVLEGPSSGRSQSFEKYQAEDRPFDVADFEVDVKEESGELVVLACPEGQKPVDQVRSETTGKTLVHFDCEQCVYCVKNKRCPVKIGNRVATLTIDEISYVGAARHHRYMGDKEYRKQCAIRAGIEATVSEMVRAHGMRKSRHRTESRTRLQMLFAAIACNVKRFIRHGSLHVYVVTGKPSISSVFSFAKRFIARFFLCEAKIFCFSC